MSSRNHFPAYDVSLPSHRPPEFPSLHVDGNTVKTSVHVAESAPVMPSSKLPQPTNTPSMPDIAPAKQSPLASAVEQQNTRRKFATYVASILDAAAEGKPLQYRGLYLSALHPVEWCPFTADEERDVGFNFKEIEYRLAKVKRTVTFRLALLSLVDGKHMVVAPRPENYESVGNDPLFVQWLGEEQTRIYEV